MPTTLSLTWDGGWSHGCPGEGRIRIDDPNPAKARHLLISVSDGGGAHLGELIPSWSIGDAVAVEGPGARIVGLIIGAIIHRGSHYRLPIAVRAVAGSFRDNVGVVLVHATSTDLLTVAAEPMVSAPAVSPQPVIPTVPPSPVASPSVPNPLEADLADANAQVAALRDVLDKLLNDPTTIIAAEGKAA
jgi:hypothetical protein